MPIKSIRESRFPAAKGTAVIEAIWRDTPGYDCHLNHEPLIDGTPGHLLVISQWATRRHADAIHGESGP